MGIVKQSTSSIQHTHKISVEFNPTRMHGIKPTPMASADELFQNGQIRPFFSPYIAYASDSGNPIQDNSYGSFSPRPSPANRDPPDNLQSYCDEEDGAESSKHEAEGNKRRRALKELLSNTKGDKRVHNNRKAEEEKKMYSTMATAPKHHISSASNWASKSGSESPHALHYKQQKERAHQMSKKTQLPYRQGLWVCFGIHWKCMDAMVDV